MSTSQATVVLRAVLLSVVAWYGPVWAEDEAPVAPPAIDVQKPTFFKQHQEADGHWSVSGLAAHCTSAPGCGSVAVSDAADVAVTGQILLVYEEAGYDHVTPTRHRAMLQKAVSWLVARQKADGSFGASLEADCWASAGLGLAYSLSGDQALKAPVTRAMASLLKRRVRDQEGKPCGWGDQDSGWIDVRLTAWAMLALHAGVAGEVVDAKDAQRSIGAIEAAMSVVTEPKDFPIRFNIRDRTGEGSGGAPFAALASSFSGGVTDPLRHSLRDALLDAATALNPLTEPELGALFATSEALGFARSNDRARWNDAYAHWTGLKDRLERDHVHDETCSDGTWDPESWPGMRGRLETTALAALALETFYRSQRLAVMPSAP